MSQDYPSVAMVKCLLQEKGISPIFLVTSRQQTFYNVRLLFVTCTGGLTLCCISQHGLGVNLYV